MEMKLSDGVKLASVMIDAPARINIMNRGCIKHIAMPNPNNLIGPILSKIDMNFGGGVSGSSSPKKVRMARIISNKPKTKKKATVTVLVLTELLEDIKPARLRHSSPQSTYTMYLARINEIDLTNP